MEAVLIKQVLEHPPDQFLSTTKPPVPEAEMSGRLIAGGDVSDEQKPDIINFPHYPIRFNLPSGIHPDELLNEVIHRDKFEIEQGGEPRELLIEMTKLLWSKDSKSYSPDEYSLRLFANDGEKVISQNTPRSPLSMMDALQSLNLPCTAPLKVTRNRRS